MPSHRNTKVRSLPGVEADHSCAGISDVNPPAELLTEATTIEYRPPVQQTAGPVRPIFLFVVDVSCKHEDEIAALRKALLRALDVIPPDALVGFITFGATVFFSRR